jgi:hypothetical protein
MSFTDQGAFDVRSEWGPGAPRALAGCRTFIVVDVLSFTTCVSIAAAAGASIFPARSREEAAALASRHGATLAGARGAGYSLSPASLVAAPAGLRLVLPSPNGAVVSLEAHAPDQRQIPSARSVLCRFADRAHSEGVLERCAGARASSGRMVDLDLFLAPATDPAASPRIAVSVTGPHDTGPFVDAFPASSARWPIAWSPRRCGTSCGPTRGSTCRPPPASGS